MKNGAQKIGVLNNKFITYSLSNLFNGQKVVGAIETISFACRYLKKIIILLKIEVQHKLLCMLISNYFKLLL